ncbi:MAG: dipeptide epimerase [Cyanobacteria bacterium P01_D01_bin.71]
MQISVTPFTVHKRVALTISRGTTAQSVNLWVRLLADGIEGWGEASAFSLGSYGQTTEQLSAELTDLGPKLAEFHPLERQRLSPILAGLSSAARAAVDMALHDWLGKHVGLPLWQLWGLDRRRIGPTAVTVGISSPAQAVERWQLWRSQIPAVQSIKIKLGSPAGMTADQAMMTALLAEIPAGTKVSIDANGGWDLETAIAMADWLAERGVTYLEQPLPVALDHELKKLSARSPLPIFVDESCFTAQDVARLMGRVHGVNIKLMKAGGLTAAWRLIHTARACGLGVMFGCYSDSAIANTALAHLAPLADHLDLDSHLNLKNDPFQGATLQAGCLVPNDLPGLGLTHHELSHG